MRGWFCTERITDSRSEVSYRLPRSQVNIRSTSQPERHEWDVLARVIRAVERGVVAMVGTQHDQILVGIEYCKKGRDPVVEVNQSLGVTLRVTAVTEEHVEVDKVGHQKPALHAAKGFQSESHSIDVSLTVNSLGDTLAVVDIGDLSDSHHRCFGILHQIKHRLSGRLHPEVLAVVGPFEVVGPSPNEGAGNDAPQVKRVQDVARDLADPVELIDRHDVFVRRNLEHRIARGVDDQLASFHVLNTKLSEDHRSGRGLIADVAVSGLADEGVENFGGEAVRVQRKRLLDQQPAHFPVPGSRVFARRPLTHAAERTRCGLNGCYTRNLGDVTESELFEVRKTKSTHRVSNVSQRVGSCIAVIVSIRCGTNAALIQNNDHASLHR